MMNERFNPFRSVPIEEIESEHTFHTLRHFPLISKSINSSKISINKLNNENKNNEIKVKKIKNIKLKSTHKLNELCKSSLNEFNTLSTFRYQIINERNKNNLLNSSSSFSSSSSPSSPSHNSSSSPLKNSLKNIKNLKKLNNPLKSGNEKLTKFAVRYDSRRMNNDLDGFHERVLDKTYFDYQLKRCLCVYLSPEELDAVFTYIDLDKSGFIDGVEFLRYFFKLGQDARNAIRLQAIHTTHEMEIKRAQEEVEEKQM